MKTIKIFLASSEELDYDRMVFGNLIRRLDDMYEKRGIRIAPMDKLRFAAANEDYVKMQTEIHELRDEIVEMQLNLEKKQQKLEKKKAKLEIYINIGRTYYFMGRRKEALLWAENAVASSPNNPEIIDTLATVYQGLGRYNEALEQFELCLKLKKEQEADEDSIRETEEKNEELKTIRKQLIQ